MNQIIDATARMNSHWNMPSNSAAFTFSKDAMRNLLFALSIYSTVADGDDRLDNINEIVNELVLGFNSYLESN